MDFGEEPSVNFSTPNAATGKRKRLRHSLTTMAALVSLMAAGQLWAFSLDDVAEKAKNLAAQKYVVPKSNLPSEFSEMKFADYQKIRFRSEKAEWQDLKTPFKLSFYHQGMHFNTPVKINEVTATTVNEIKYDPSRFDFGDLKFDAKATEQLGYAGFRVLYPINKADKQDEIMTLLGASYFRVIGKDQTYGLSARGMAIDTALPSGEEFPHFTEFWIERPKAGEKQLVIYALLDSPRATGAYRLVLRPGTDSVVDVKTRMYLRENVAQLGVAPLTSMYLFGANQPPKTLNYRRELHDSNGLSIHTGNDEWIWRPLNNPKHLGVSSFAVENPKGFGLLQRGRDFSHYEDLDDRYDQRPSAWIEPQGDWGKGTVNLVEIPTADETNDNIVAFWKPESLPEAGQPIDFSYRLHWSNDERALGPQKLATVKQTLRSTGDVKQSNLIREPDGSVAFLVDFEGPALKALLEDTPVRSQISLDDNAKLMENNVRYNPQTKGWRLTLRFKVNDPSKPVEMRAALVRDLPVEVPAAVDEDQAANAQAPVAAPIPANAASTPGNVTAAPTSTPATPAAPAAAPANDVPPAPPAVEVLTETWSNQLPADE